MGLIQQAEGRGYLNGINIRLINICLKAPIISHLLFADERVLFFIANKDEAQTMKQILRMKLHLGKQLVFQSPNIL